MGFYAYTLLVLFLASGAALLWSLEHEGLNAALLRGEPADWPTRSLALALLPALTVFLVIACVSYGAGHSGWAESWILVTGVVRLVLTGKAAPEPSDEQ